MYLMRKIVVEKYYGGKGMKDCIKKEFQNIKIIEDERLRSRIDIYVILFGTNILKTTIKDILKEYKQGPIGKLFGKNPLIYQKDLLIIGKQEEYKEGK